MMKSFLRAASFLLLLALAACGTFQVEWIPTATPTLYIPPTPTPITYNLSPEECAKFPDDAALPASPDWPGSYIGRHYGNTDFPAGIAFRASAPIDDDHFWQLVSRPTLEMEFITQTLCTRPDGTSYNIILDAVEVPAEGTGYGRAGYCLPDTASGPFIVYGRYNRTMPEVTLGSATGWAMTDLDFGLSIDIRRMRFMPYPITDLQCLRLERQ